MRYAIIENGKVENLISATPEYISESGLNGVLVDGIQCDIGWDYSEGVFSSPIVSEVFEFIPVKPIYMRLALMEFGILPIIEGALSQPGNEVSRIAFEYALEFKREDAMINGFAQAMGLSSEVVDNLFKRGMAMQNA